jgi:uncharacterized membrane protein YraQ (UPF0718 family)
LTWFSFDPGDFAFSFLSILFEGIPFLLLGSLVSGVVDAWVPPGLLTRILPRNRGASILLSGLLGLIFPMCECGSVVVIRRFIRKGFPVSCAATYMLAAPIVSPVVALSTYAAFKGNNPALMTSLRLLIGYLIAAAIGFVFLRIRRESVLQPGVLSTLPRQFSRAKLSIVKAPQEEYPQSSARGKVATALGSAPADFLDVAFFLVIGAAIAAVFNTAINQRIIEPLAASNSLAIVSMMLLAFTLAVCSTSDAFIAASFVTFPAVAKLAFLVFGPMLDIKLVFLYATVFRKRFILALAIGLTIAVTLICLQLTTIMS